MYFQDVSCLEGHLNNDWAVLLRNLKRREESHFQLLTYNKNIITRQRNQDDELFVKDQIMQHLQMHNRVEESNRSMQQEEKALLDKYEDCITSDEEISKLMGRVGARVLQTGEAFLDKCKLLDKELIEKYRLMKNQLIKLINQKEQIKVQQIAHLVVNYSQTKLGNETEKLKKLIRGLENGQYQRLQEIYAPKPPKPLLIIEKKKSLQKPKNSSVPKEIPSPIREQIKKAERVRKQKQKLVTKMTVQLYSTMELSKTQLLEDMTCTTKDKSNTLYNQIFSRNKFNYEQIIAFQAKEEQFHQKVKIFKEKMQRQSEKITEVLIQKPILRKIEEEDGSPTRKKSEELLQFQSCDDVTLVDKKQSFRYRINSPKTKKQARQVGMHYSVVQSTNENFNHFKFDTNGNEIYARSNRNRLPQIPSFHQNYRASSFQQRIEGKNSRLQNLKNDKQHRPEMENAEEQRQDRPRFNDERQAVRPKMVLKNIEVGVEGAVRRVDPIVHSKDRRGASPNPMEYTFYVRKSGYRFFEPKHNLLV